jgi:hypothetical protein
MWIEFLKSGRHTDSGGRKHEFSPERLDIIANINNGYLSGLPNNGIPLTKGHKNFGDPASGWVKEIKRKGGRLIARLEDVSKDVMKQIALGSYKNVSVSLDGDKIRHIALLGADSPAVQGLEPFKYTEKSDFQAAESEVSDIKLPAENNDDSKLLLDEIDRLKSENQNYLSKLSELEKQNRMNGFKEYVMNMNDSGVQTFSNLTDIDSAVDLLEAAYLHDKNSGDDGVMLNKMKSFFNNNKHTVSLSEFAVKQPERNIISNFEAKNVEPERLRKHLETLDYMQNNPDMSYEQALNNIY